MAERTLLDQQAEGFFEELWQRGDHWEFDSSAFEQARYARLMALLAGRRYAHVLELGCGSGSFTQHLAGLADHVVALDISPLPLHVRVPVDRSGDGGLPPGQYHGI
jgi:SAM-dependent methyltransferase